MGHRTASAWRIDPELQVFLNFKSCICVLYEQNLSPLICHFGVTDQLEVLGVTTGILIDKINLISFQKNRPETQAGHGTLGRLVASCLVL